MIGKGFSEKMMTPTPLPLLDLPFPARRGVFPLDEGPPRYRSYARGSPRQGSTCRWISRNPFFRAGYRARERRSMPLRLPDGAAIDVWGRTRFCRYRNYHKIAAMTVARLRPLPIGARNSAISGREKYELPGSIRQEAPASDAIRPLAACDRGGAAYVF